MTCVDTIGSFICTGNDTSVCPQGECDICVENSQCIVDNSTDTIRIPFCECLPGFEGIATSECTDVDECTKQTHDCNGTLHEFCVNVPGSFACICEDGFSYLSGDDPYQCQAQDFQ